MAQLIVERILTPEVEQVDTLSTTIRGKGGVGSTHPSQDIQSTHTNIPTIPTTEECSKRSESTLQLEDYYVDKDNLLPDIHIPESQPSDIPINTKSETGRDQTNMTIPNANLTNETSETETIQET